MKKYITLIVPENAQQPGFRFEMFEADNDDLAMLVADACCYEGERVEGVREEAPEI